MMVNVLGICMIIIALGFSSALAAPTQRVDSCVATIPGVYTLAAFNTTLPVKISNGISPSLFFVALRHPSSTLPYSSPWILGIFLSSH
jgi:hypothetical protein